MCTPAALDFVRSHLSPSEAGGRSVLEAGSYNVNGSARPAIEALRPASYLGVDITPGPGVDRICGVNDLVGTFGRAAFDVVVCTEVLEHVRDWRGAVSNLKNVLKPGGVLVLTTRSPGFAYHGWPYDFWRFDAQDIGVIFSDMEIAAVEPDRGSPGVFLKARRPAEFREKSFPDYAPHSVLKGRRAAAVSALDAALFTLAHPGRTVYPRFRRAAVRWSLRLRYGGEGPAEAAGRKAPCGFCGAEDFEFAFAGRDYMAFSPAVYNVVRCASCGAVCVNPRPADLPARYAPYRKGVPDSPLVGWLSPDRVKLARSLRPAGRALDIGCGTGRFLAGLKEAGWETFGCDVSAEACEAAARACGRDNILNRPAEELALPEGSFDLVTMWHSLEHLDKPLAVLKKAAALLKEDGTLIIESPDFSSWQARFFKDRWFMLDLPRHLYQIEPGDLEEKLGLAGLEVRKRDAFVSPAAAFVSLKKSLLRYAGLERPPESESAAAPAAAGGLRLRRAPRALLRLCLDCACAAAGAALVLLRQEDTFRIYCGRKARGAGDGLR